MKFKIHTFFIAILGIAALTLTLKADESEEPAYTGSEASEWIPLYGEEWFNHYADVYYSLYPGGRSDRYHDAYIAEAWNRNPATKDWTIYNRKYTFDGQWFSVLWFYKSTKVDTGFKQIESTLAIGKVVDGKLAVWIEYFDDSVGHMQELRIMPPFEDDDEGLPWPPNAPISQEYRP